MTIDEIIAQRFQYDLHERIKESNIPIGQLDVNFKGEKAFIRDKITGRIVGEVDVKITMERYEPKKMTRSEVEKAILAYCDPVATPCKECKCYKKCVKRMPFEWLSNEGLQEYYKLMYGSEMKVEKMEPVKVLEQITKITYPEKMKDVLPMKEFVKNFLEKGYKVEILTHSVSNDLDVVVYKEVEMEE
mgnify:CR=1 FL=1|jgi:hypothetical protein